MGKLLKALSLREGFLSSKGNCRVGTFCLRVTTQTITGMGYRDAEEVADWLENHDKVPTVSQDSRGLYGISWQA